MHRPKHAPLLVEVTRHPSIERGLPTVLVDTTRGASSGDLLEDVVSISTERRKRGGESEVGDSLHFADLVVSRSLERLTDLLLR
jgi:hypothetical protein